MKQFQRITAILLIIFSFFILITSQVNAENLTVTCDSSDCVTSPGAQAALFGADEGYNSDIKPGDTIHRTITVTNNRSEDCYLYLDTHSEIETTPKSLAEVLFTVVKDSGAAYFGSIDTGGNVTQDKALDDLFTYGPVSLGVVGAGTTKVYDWLVAIDTGVGNEYQKTSTQFDFDMTFECGNPIPAPTPTPTPTPTQTPTPTGGTGGAFTWTCADTLPGMAPANFRITAIDVNSISLAWNPVDGVTHYALIFTRTSDGAQYGSDNIGTVTSYTITNLAGGTAYTFEVFGVNGCAPGPRSTLTTGTILGAFIETNPIGEDNQILGVQTATPSAILSSMNGDILGDACGCTDKPYLWWIPLVIQLILTLLYYSVYIQKERYGRWLVFPVVLAVVSQAIHTILGCNCALPKLCDWYWLFNLLISTIPAYWFYTKYFRK